MDNALTELLNGNIDYSSDKVIALLKQTVCPPDATKEEFGMFAHTCKTTGLNPLKREIWFIKTKGYTNRHGDFVPPKVQIMIGLNGYLAIANDSSEFDGLETEIEHDEAGKPIAATCLVYRKDRGRPTKVKVLFKEFSTGQNLWLSKPTVMIEKVAIAHAIRRSFPSKLTGTYIPEEIGQDEDAINTTATRAAPDVPVALPEPKRYVIPHEVLVDKTYQIFLEKRGAVEVEPGVYESKQPLGAKFEQYRIKEEASV